MSRTALLEIKRRIFTGFPKTDGEAIIAVELAINDAIRSIASVRDFNELIVTDEENAFTATNQLSYDASLDWNLTRLKKIYSIKLMDGSNSRKLIFKPSNELNEALPYPEQISTGYATHYTPIGSSMYQLTPIPDGVYPLYIKYSQWPAALSADTDLVPFDNLDTQIVFLAKDIANAYLGGTYFDFAKRAGQYLAQGVREENREPDHKRVAQPFSTSPKGNHGEYWNDPFCKRS